MGFSITGLAMGDNFEKDINQVSENLEIGFDDITEVTDGFSMRIEEKDIAFVCFSEVATVIFHEASLLDQKLYSQTTDSLSFEYYEVPMIFSYRYVRDCAQIRSLLSIDGETIYSLGREMKEELGIKRVEDRVVKLVENLSEINILRVSNRAKVFRVKLCEYKGPRTRQSEKEIQAMLVERRISRNNSHDSDLFNFDNY